MSGKSRSHSEARWEKLPETIVRCKGTLQSGGRCKREAELGAVVCDVHGGAAPQVRRRAADRVVNAADRAAELLEQIITDPAVPMNVRAKVAMDLLDRGGLGATQRHQFVDQSEDPVLRLFTALSEHGAEAFEAEEAIPGEVEPDLQQAAMDQLEQSWTPDAKVVALPGVPGPYAFEEDPEVVARTRPPRRR